MTIDRPDINRLHTAAEKYHKMGYNCAQSVVMAFDGLIPEDKIAAVRDALGGFGLGMGDMSQICGAASGANAVRGSLLFSTPADKPRLNKMSAEYMSAFSDAHGGLCCHELKGKSVPCSDLIRNAITILHRQLWGE